MKLTKEAVLKKINGHTDCASEFLLCNKEVDNQDREWMIQETNRSFKTWGIPLKTLDVEFDPPTRIWWDVEFLSEKLEAVNE